MASYVCPDCNEEEGSIVDRRQDEAGGWVRSLECGNCGHEWEFGF